MATDQDVTDVKRMIQSFYRFAGINPAWDGEVNEQVAEIFGEMLQQTAKCSNALKWIPVPSGGPASITWLATSLGKALYKHLQNNLSVTCAKGVVYKWGTHLYMASRGLAYQGRFATWA